MWVRYPLDHRWKRRVPRRHDIIQVMTQRHKQIKEMFPSKLHFSLQGSAPHKRLTTLDDQGEIMSANVGILAGRGVLIGISHASNEGLRVDVLQRVVLLESDLLQPGQAKFRPDAVHDGMLDDVTSQARDEDCRAGAFATTTFFKIRGPEHLHVPRALTRGVVHAGIVVASVHVFEKGGDGFRFFARQIDLEALATIVLMLEEGRKVRRLHQHISMGCKVSSMCGGNLDRRLVGWEESAANGKSTTILPERLMQLRPRLGILGRLPQPWAAMLLNLVLGPEGTSKHDCEAGGG